MRTWFVLLLLIACKKDAAPRIDRESLWALVPDNAVAGLVVTPEALGRIERGYTAFRAVARAPELAEIGTAIDEMEKELKKPMTLGALGLSAHESAALFFVNDLEPIIVVPLADRSRFVKISGGTRGGTTDKLEMGFQCKLVKDVYACARDAALVDRLGKGKVPDIVGTVGVRGEIEAFLAGPGGPTVGAAVQLSRGGFTAHLAATGVPAPLLLMLANAKPRIEPTTAGFAMVNFGRLVAALGDKVPAEPVVDGVTTEALVKALAGPLTLTVEHGASAFDARIPLLDSGPVERVLRKCDEVPDLDELETVVTDDGCRVEIAEMNLRLDGWVDDKVLRIGNRASQSPGRRAAMSPGAQQLANGEWAVAILGRGSFLAPTELTLPPETFPPDDNASLRFMTLFTELGVGVRLDGDVVRGMATVRTIWENSDDVVAKLTAIDITQFATGGATAKAKAIADAAPASPFAADYQAGMVSIVVPFLVIAGVEEAISAAVLEYVKW